MDYAMRLPPSGFLEQSEANTCDLTQQSCFLLTFLPSAEMCFIDYFRLFLHPTKTIFYRLFRIFYPQQKPVFTNFPKLSKNLLYRLF